MNRGSIHANVYCWSFSLKCLNRKWTHTISSISTIPIVLLLQYRNRFVISIRSFLMSLEIFSHSWYFRIITRKYLSIRTEDYIWIIFLSIVFIIHRLWLYLISQLRVTRKIDEYLSRKLYLLSDWFFLEAILFFYFILFTDV